MDFLNKTICIINDVLWAYENIYFTRNVAMPLHFPDIISQNTCVFCQFLK